MGLFVTGIPLRMSHFKMRHTLLNKRIPNRNSTKTLAQNQHDGGEKVEKSVKRRHSRTKLTIKNCLKNYTTT